MITVTRTGLMIYLTYFVCCRHTVCVHVTLTSSKTVLGKTVKIICAAVFTDKEEGRELRISNRQGNITFQWTDKAKKPGYRESNLDSRYSVEIETIAGNRTVMTMSIADVWCGDEGTYVCTAGHVTRHNSRTVLKTESSRDVQLRLQVLPSPPQRLSVTPESHTVKEHGWFDIECSAVVGHSDAGWLEWRIYREQQRELISQEDPRIILHEAHGLPRGDSCMIQAKSRLRLQVTRRDQGCHVVCFVRNTYFQPSAPALCEFERRDLCAKTSKLNVHYGVTVEKMQIYIVPVSPVREGITINLVCFAEAFPPALYTWYKVLAQPPRETVLRSRQVNNSNWLVLANFSSQNDAGIYKCTAWNWVLEVEHFTASQEIFVGAADSVTVEHQRLQSVSMDKMNEGKLVSLGILLSIAVTVFTAAVIFCFFKLCKCMQEIQNRNHETEVPQSTSEMQPRLDSSVDAANFAETKQQLTPKGAYTPSFESEVTTVTTTTYDTESE